MLPGMWSLELVVGGNKVVAGSDGKTVWRHTPWLGTHAAKGPQRPLRRIIQHAASADGAAEERRDFAELVDDDYGDDDVFSRRMSLRRGGLGLGVIDSKEEEFEFPHRKQCKNSKSISTSTDNIIGKE
ncbi:hypothetical protein ACLB2K_006810 [Fragaria x ananassa]